MWAESIFVCFVVDSASSTFVQCLNRRVSSTSSDLNLLESMSFGTVSFEELLGHCNEVYKKNQVDILELEDRLKSFGYVPGMVAPIFFHFYLLQLFEALITAILLSPCRN